MPIIGDSQNEGKDTEQQKIDLIVEEEIVPKLNTKASNQAKKKLPTPKPNKIDIAEKTVLPPAEKTEQKLDKTQTENNACP